MMQMEMVQSNLNNAKITSNFSKKRKHPVLGFTRAHKGVDFRASTGTPIPAAGSGRVVARSYNRGHGNFVKIRHNGSYETLYAHMSRFAKGVNVGTNVRQGQTIGYVGSTGYSTGPHLHFAIATGWYGGSGSGSYSSYSTYLTKVLDPKDILGLPKMGKYWNSR